MTAGSPTAASPTAASPTVASPATRAPEMTGGVMRVPHVGSSPPRRRVFALVDRILTSAVPTTAPLDDETARDSPSTPRPAPSAAASTEETASDSPFLRFLPPSRGSRRVERSKPFWELREQWSASADARATGGRTILEAAPPAAAPAKWGGPPQRAATARAATPTSPVAPAAAKPPTCRCAARWRRPIPRRCRTSPNRRGRRQSRPRAKRAWVRQRWRRRRPAPPRPQQRHAHQITSPLAGATTCAPGAAGRRRCRASCARWAAPSRRGKRPAAARAPLSANVARAENRGQRDLASRSASEV